MDEYFDPCDGCNGSGCPECNWTGRGAEQAARTAKLMSFDRERCGSCQTYRCESCSGCCCSGMFCVCGVD